MKRYEVTIEIPAEMLVEYEKMLSYDADDMIANGIPPLGNISTWSAKFPNGFEADIKLNSSEDDVWTEGVLFDEEGHQLCFTEVCDTLSGRWFLSSVETSSRLKSREFEESSVPH